MSHFPVLVVTKPGVTPDAQLQPFHEFECTGDNDQYVVDVDQTEEVLSQLATAKAEDSSRSEAEALAAALSWYGLEDSVVDDEAKVDRDDEHKFGFAVVKDGVLVKAVDRTNPNKKWDWWTVGGRWKGMLRSNGLPVDTGLASEIDWNGMLDESTAEAGAFFDKITAIIAGRSHNPWKHYYDQVQAGTLTIDQARDQYNDQPVVKDTKEELGWFGADERLTEITTMARDAYVTFKAQDNARTYALLDADGKWHEPGEMGWFGMSSETPESRREFTQKWWDHVRAIPADRTVTVVDCHI